MSTDDIDLNALRRIAEAADPQAWGRTDKVFEDVNAHYIVQVSPTRLIALLDRIEALEAELDYLKAVENQQIKRLEAERENLIYSRDIQAGVLRSERARADRAEARLDRVTDDSMIERLAEIPLWWKKRMDDGYVSTGARTEREVASDALAAIRAVVNQEQDDV